jgi:hypothetical protein
MGTCTLRTEYIRGPLQLGLGWITGLFYLDLGLDGPNPCRLDWADLISMIQILKLGCRIVFSRVQLTGSLE